MADEYAFHLRVTVADGGKEVSAAFTGYGGVEHDAADAWKDVKQIETLTAGIGGDYVEFGGLQDQFAAGDAGGVLRIDDEEAWAYGHGFWVTPCSKLLRWPRLLGDGDSLDVLEVAAVVYRIHAGKQAIKS